MPFDGQGDNDGARRLLRKVLEQFSRRGALVQELIVARERARLEERAVAQKAAYHERDAAQVRKRSSELDSFAVQRPSGAAPNLTKAIFREVGAETEPLMKCIESKFPRNARHL